MNNRISVNPQIHFGKPCVAGTRIPVQNVLELVRKEFTIDEKRIYLLGHSMGGGGTWHLGTKYPDVWAGLAPIAPAAFGQPTGLDKLKNVPVIVVQGDNDTLVRPEGTRRWVAKLKELNVPHEYLEIAGAGHGDVITKGMPQIFEFFEKRHSTGHRCHGIAQLVTQDGNEFIFLPTGL